MMTWGYGRKSFLRKCFACLKDPRLHKKTYRGKRKEFILEKVRKEQLRFDATETKAISIEYGLAATEGMIAYG